MNDQTFSALVAQAETNHRGWIHGGSVPACDVLIDGKLMPRNSILAVHRTTGRARIIDQPIKLDKHRKRIAFRTVRGRNIELRLKQAPTFTRS